MGRESDAIRLARKRERALAGARAAIAALAERGVTAKLVGSLAEDRFDRASDVDLLVTSSPRSLKYALESIVEDCLPGLPFDVLYLDELPQERVHRRREAARAHRPDG
ncbi:MAG: nucleotidyltransferase domain-containing protein [Caulobacteraceae bacterium]